MTLTEKILARAAGKAKVQAGDNLWVNADVLMTHDVCGPGTIGVFKREFGKDAKVWDKNRIVIIPDHYIFTADSKSNRNVDILREFAREQGLEYFYDVIDDPKGTWKFDTARGALQRQYGSRYAGVCHTALPQKGHTRPGEILFGTDSHTCMAGAFNQFATGIGNTDAGFVMGTGKLLIKVPETMHFRLEGRLQPGVMAKDIILHCIGEIGFDGATYRAMQFDGPGAAGLSMDDRMTIANMAIEAGGKNGIFEFDARTAEYVDARVKLNGTKSGYQPVERDRDEKFVYELVVDLDQLEPTVACHPDPGQRKKAKELSGLKLDRAYVGSCTGGKTSDFVEFARVLRGKKVAIDTFGVPATPEIVRDLQPDHLGRAGQRRGADDRERGLRRVPGRPGGYLWPHQQIRHQVHQRHQPQFPRPHGRQGIAGLPRFARDGRRKRTDRQGDRPAGIPPVAIAPQSRCAWEVNPRTGLLVAVSTRANRACPAGPKWWSLSLNRLPPASVASRNC
jgi:3-isopropylmalate/(R)-2-methylmalate dehydratase large subunit